MTTMQMIQGIPAGKSWGVSPKSAAAQKLPYYIVVRKVSAGYEIEAGWEDNSHDAAAAADSATRGLIGWGHGAAKTVGTATEAASLYESAKAALESRKLPRAALGL